MIAAYSVGTELQVVRNSFQMLLPLCNNKLKMENGHVALQKQCDDYEPHWNTGEKNAGF